MLFSLRRRRTKKNMWTQIFLSIFWFITVLVIDMTDMVLATAVAGLLFTFLDW